MNRQISSSELIENSVFRTFDPRANDAQSRICLSDAERLRVEAELADDRLAANYQTHSFDLKKQIAVTVGYFRETPYVFSTVWRSPFYPPGVARVLNRRFKSTAFRLHGGYRSLKDPAAFLHKTVGQQMAFVRESQPDIHSFFFSREPYQPRLAAKFASSMSYHLAQSWFTTDQLVLVCNNPASWHCWQHIVAHSSTPNSPQSLGFQCCRVDQLVEKLGPPPRGAVGAT